MDSSQVIVFLVDEEEYGLSISQVDIIEKPLEIFKVPGAPEYIEGLVIIRKKVHTVFNLRKRLDIADKGIDENTKILIVEIDSCPVCLIVDSVKEIINVQPEDMEKTPSKLSGLKKNLVSGAVKHGDRHIFMLDTASVL